jgi:hypothetical protein
LGSQLKEFFSEIAAGQLAAAGTDVVYAPVPGADHFTVLAAVARATVAWLAEMFAGVPGWNHEDAAAEPR